MPKKPREMEKIILADGWIFQAQVGSHRHYIHPSKSGKVTIPFHCKDIPKGKVIADVMSEQVKVTSPYEM